MTIEIHDLTQSGHGGRDVFSTPEFLDLRKQNHVFEDVIGDMHGEALYTRAGATERFGVGLVTPTTFEFLGVGPLLGRPLTAEDYKSGAPRVFVMRYDTWMSRFSGDPNILNRSFVLNGKASTLVGIMPRRFAWGDHQIWIPASMDLADRAAPQSYFFALGRLKPGVTAAQANADLNIVTANLARVYRADYPQRFSARVESLADQVAGSFRTVLLVLLFSVGLLLLIGCGNVANLLLARATAREKEMAIRASIGASRWRLIRLLMVESLLL